MTTPSTRSPAGTSFPAGAARITSYHHAFAVELVRALTKRNVTQRSLAAALGVSQRQVWYWASGRTLPYIANAARITDALDWPSIVEIVRLGRTVPCRTCGRRVVSEVSNASRRYCDETCRRVGVKAGRQGQVPDSRDGKIARLTAAVDAMCRACEPAGVCSDGSCALRLVSPLPLRAGLALVQLAEDGRRSRWDDPAARERASVVLRERWAKSADRRERVSKANRETWAAMTPEQRAARGRRISEGIRRRKAA